MTAASGGFDFGALVNTLLSNIVIPEVVHWIADKHAATGVVPTVAEVQAHFDDHFALLVSQSDEYLALKGHPQATTIPQPAPAPPLPPEGSGG